MEERLKINGYCAITKNTVLCNGEVNIEEEGLTVKEFFKTLYREYSNDYSKFFKMDDASKLTFLTAEILLKNCAILEEEKDELAIVLANKSASLNTDRKYQESIQEKENYYPSPAVFVYTLPNIGIGEVCIKHKIYGENAFLVAEKFDVKRITEYATILINTNKAKFVLCGWVDVDNDEYTSVMYLVSKEGGEEYSEEKINKLYQSIR
ncbi:3-oxoacyl-ACP synthase [Tenacibaculum halocynthiae]|uniref:3-oxoacyl-ACP synthase n=1 Tax=Tenacibaculum halocynthiae TaxID=1254437 RepID=UPI0038950A5B